MRVEYFFDTLNILFLISHPLYFAFQREDGRLVVTLQTKLIGTRLIEGKPSTTLQNICTFRWIHVPPITTCLVTLHDQARQHAAIRVAAPFLPCVRVAVIERNLRKPTLFILGCLSTMMAWTHYSGPLAVGAPASMNNMPSCAMVLYFLSGGVRRRPLHDHLRLFFSNLFSQLFVGRPGRRGWSIFQRRLEFRTYTRLGGPPKEPSLDRGAIQKSMR